MQPENLTPPCSIDLHCHSNRSDGVLTPTDVVARAAENGIQLLALTDHDTVDGLDEARLAAQQHQITLINGVEISTLWQNRGIHIVGLGFDHQHPAMTALLAQQAELRQKRAEEIGARLEKCGIEQAYAGAKSLAGGEVTRAHYARYLVQIGQVKNETQAFKRYLGQGKPGYVSPQWCDIETANRVIHQAGGVSVCAHPLRYPLTRKWLLRLLSDFQQWGGDAVEVAHSGQSPDQRHNLAKWVDELGLLASAGSDFHYPCGWIELGKNLWLPTIAKPVWQAPDFASLFMQSAV
ncbi:RNase RNM [Testudinibacter sp. TR-2022]|uniref:RNase RNM n=1 Tax=Testudinibacter sp. TR-2022 TaxID=2585029 RepID=UPI0011189F88|nr:PHP domain-containing protein [Testudinibacter sp. TR-2022]TNH07333.1 PHP domain-containing protein [Pasteurellaceae bacterium Phil11]TNH22380.1 PHP domain-containing protein [Testudinibacter sp. TR-2022]TNH29004.1 PHP domain-containing protein [Testudinibacter sp. TR-2022]